MAHKYIDICQDDIAMIHPDRLGNKWLITTSVDGIFSVTGSDIQIIFNEGHCQINMKNEVPK